MLECDRGAKAPALGILFVVGVLVLPAALWYVILLVLPNGLLGRSTEERA